MSRGSGHSSNVSLERLSGEPRLAQAREESGALEVARRHGSGGRDGRLTVPERDARLRVFKALAEGEVSRSVVAAEL